MPTYNFYRQIPEYHNVTTDSCWSHLSLILFVRHPSSDYDCLGMVSDTSSCSSVSSNHYYRPTVGRWYVNNRVALILHIIYQDILSKHWSLRDIFCSKLTEDVHLISSAIFAQNAEHSLSNILCSNAHLMSSIFCKPSYEFGMYFEMMYLK